MDIKKLYELESIMPIHDTQGKVFFQGKILSYLEMIPNLPE
jgi:hypothetical protein